jgi:hypothetical protein
MSTASAPSGFDTIRARALMRENLGEKGSVRPVYSTGRRYRLALQMITIGSFRIHKGVTADLNKIHPALRVSRSQQCGFSGM